MEISIVYEDDSLIVLDKPAGLSVNRSESQKGETLADWAEKKYKKSNIKYQKEGDKDFYNRAGIVHRLDKDTSGLLIIAKNPSSFANLQSQFAARTVLKKYQALVHGKVVPYVGIINAPVGRLPWNRRKFGVLSNGNQAQTSYLVKSIYHLNGNIYSLIEAKPTTGRTHQIRVHLKYLGHAIVGDRVYAGKKIYKEDLKFCPRLFLHAYFIAIIHPNSHKTLEIKIELPDDLRAVLTKLSK